MLDNMHVMRRLLCWLSIWAFALNIISCKDNYFVENDLHGMWQVTSVERLSTGEVTEAVGDLYYMFQRSMVMLGYKHLGVPESMTRYITHFDLVGVDSIGMGYFRNYSTGEGNNVDREDVVPLDCVYKFGIYEDYTKFHIELLKQKLILVSDSARIELRKY